MKFLVDAQLPKSLSDLINRKGFDSIHTLELPQKNLTLRREPHKVVFIRVGNLKLSKLIELFDTNFEIIVSKLKLGSMIEITIDEIKVLY